MTGGGAQNRCHAGFQRNRPAAWAPYHPGLAPGSGQALHKTDDKAAPQAVPDQVRDKASGGVTATIKIAQR
jgi:hypothetical protein